MTLELWSYEEEDAAEPRELDVAVTAAPLWKLYLTVASNGRISKEVFPEWSWGSASDYYQGEKLVAECAFELIRRPDPDGFTVALLAREAIRNGGMCFDMCCDPLEWCVRMDRDVGALASYVAAFPQPGSVHSPDESGPLELYRGGSPWCESVIVALAANPDTRSAAGYCIERLAADGIPLANRIAQCLINSPDRMVAAFAADTAFRLGITPGGEPIPDFSQTLIGEVAIRMAAVMFGGSNSRPIRTLDEIEYELTDPRLRLCVSAMLTVHRRESMRQRGLEGLKKHQVPWMGC